MTTICWDGRHLAADRRHGTNERWHYEDCKFIASVNRDVWYTSTGTSAVGAAWAAWADAGSDPHGMLPYNVLEGYQGCLIRISGAGVHMLDYRVPYWTWAGNAWAWGSGADFALAAMKCGKSAMGAVEIAATLDPETGDGVDFIDVAYIATGVHRRGPESWAVVQPVTVPDAMFERLRAMPLPTEYPAVIPPPPPQATITKPTKLKFSGTDAHAEERWAVVECSGRLSLGTGCGHCLRCNREWHAIQRTITPDAAQLDDASKRATVERWCERWNAASKADDKPLIAKLGMELRAVTFPAGVALEWRRDSDYPHGCQMVVDVPTAD